jgi:two-component system, cell cycle sensor histidine kinase and response regulator CckA
MGTDAKPRARRAGNRLLDALMGPHPRITEPEDRRGARLFAALMLIQLALVVCGLIAINVVWKSLEGHAIWGDRDAWVVMSGALLIAVSYLLLKVGLYRAGAALYIGIAALVAVAAPFAGTEAEIGLLSMLVIPVLLAAMVFRFPWVILVFGVVVAAALALLLAGPLSPSQTGTGFTIVVVMAVTCALVLVLRSHFSALERDRLGQIREKEREITEKEGRLRALVVNAGDAILVVDEDGTPRFITGAFEEISGLSVADTLGRPGLPTVHPDDQKRVETEFLEVSRFPNASRRMQWRQPLPAGGLRILEAVVTNRLGTPGVNGIVVTIRDITERIHAEEHRTHLEGQLQQASKMESIGRLAGGVAHDFNNLLTAVIGNADLLGDEIPREGAAREALDEIIKASSSAASLTRQLLAFSRRQIIEPRVVALNDLIAPMHKMLSRLIGEDIELRTVLGPGAGTARVDPGLVEQIVVNLCVNARDAMPGGGTLFIETSRAVIGPQDDARHPLAAAGEYALLTVADTGMGMSPEVRQHIFEPFFTTKPQGKGTGLGLATVYGAVRQSDGHIEVDSVPGRGTRFRIYFPIVHSPADEMPVKDGSVEVPGGRETILLVEDERFVRDLAIRTLTRLGYQVMHAVTAEDALALARSRQDPVHLLLTDVVLPGMNGRQLAAELAACHPEARVLFSSGYTRDIIAQHGVLEDGISFLAKPYAMGELARRVRSALDGA